MQRSALRRGPAGLLLGLLPIAGSLLRPDIAGAQPAAGSVTAEEPPRAAGPELTPPALLTFMEADYPQEALAQGVEGAVLLRLTIGADGSVSSAEVVRPAQHGFDVAAQQAALRFRFVPALRDGAPVPSRILYEYVFRLPAQPAPPAPSSEGSAPPGTAGATSSQPLGAHREAPTEALVPQTPPPATEIIDVTATGISAAEQRRQSAEAVTVVETELAQRESADMGEVLRRTQGVGLQRAGGLGSSTRFSLNGMTDDQIRFFIDGVPLEFSGYLSLSAVPVSLVELVELYRGVVPTRFGVDALGGAVNLVSDDNYDRTRASLSYQGGSFGTNRVAAQLRQRVGDTPLVVSASAYYDYADNDYPIDVEVPDDLGRPQRAQAYRFHDAYRALGASVEAGVVGVPWAHRLLLRLYATDSYKELQHNQVMTVPYGEVESGEQVQGATLRYENPLDFAPGLSLSLLGAYARRGIDFLDDSTWVYDWFGQRIREKLEPGEVGVAQDTHYVEQRALGRLGLSYQLATEHDLRLVATVNRTSRAGENALFVSDDYLDPASAEQNLLSVVSGIEYELDGWADRLENITFVKHYYYRLSAEQGEEFGQAPVDQGFGLLKSSSGVFGMGDVVRFRIAPWAFIKASYERAVRLPPSEQIFGDGRLTLANYELEPEVSHNLNLGVSASQVSVGAHLLRGELSGFLRDTDRLIQGLPFGSDLLQYHNIWSSRGLGLEAAAGWTSPGSFLSLDANVTWVDQRNTSSAGPFGDYDGDRIPNRPWLYANASARARVSDFVTPSDELSLTWYTSYVKDFFRSWESAGRADYKITIDAQLLHSAALTYLVSSEHTFATTLEVQNLSDERAYDTLGVQKPGRAYYFKASFEL